MVKIDRNDSLVNIPTASVISLRLDNNYEKTVPALNLTNVSKIIAERNPIRRDSNLGAEESNRHTQLHASRNSIPTLHRVESISSLTIIQSICDFPSKCLHSISYSIQHFFYLYGNVIAKHPYLFIVLSLFLCAISSIGFIRFETETRPSKLWIPEDSDFIKVSKWQRKNFPDKHRFQSVVYEAENVLDPAVLLQLLDVHEIISDIEVLVDDYINETNIESYVNLSSRHTVSWKDVCAKLPSLLSIPFFGRKKRSAQEDNNNEIEYMQNIEDNYAILHNLYINENILLLDKASVPTLGTRSTGDTSNLLSLTKQERTKRQSTDWSTYLPRGSYCTLIEQVKLECFEKSLLEIWGYDREVLKFLTKEDIIDAINTVDTSAIFGYPTNFSEYLGGITRDQDGNIIGAKAMTQSWLSKINTDKVVEGAYVDSLGSGVEVDPDAFKWEKAFVEKLLNISDQRKSVQLYFMSAHSFNQVTNDVVDDDLEYFIFGYILVFSYIVTMLGKFNLVEVRPFLSFIGITSVILSIVVSNGVASALGFKFSPVNNILPFLLLGLGIDDMFVIMQAFGESSDIYTFNISSNSLVFYMSSNSHITNQDPVIKLRVISVSVPCHNYSACL